MAISMYGGNHTRLNLKRKVWWNTLFWKRYVLLSALKKHNSILCFEEIESSTRKYCEQLI